MPLTFVICLPTAQRGPATRVRNGSYRCPVNLLRELWRAIRRQYQWKGESRVEQSLPASNNTMEEAEMTKRTGLVWLGVLMAVSIVVSGCSGVVRGEAGNGTPVDVDTPVGEVLDGLASVDEIELMIRESLPATGAVAVRGHLPDGCTSIVDTLMQIDEEAGLFRITLGTYRDPDAMCAMALVPFEEVFELPILGLPAGTYTVEVNGVTTTFELVVDNHAPMDGVIQGLAPVDEVYVMIMESLPAQVSVIISGNLPDGCTELGAPKVTRDGATFIIELPTERPADAMCTEALVPFGVAIPLEALGLKAGTYTVEANLVNVTFELGADNVLLEG
jgi:hypothetical protein